MPAQHDGRRGLGQQAQQAQQGLVHGFERELCAASEGNDYGGLGRKGAKVSLTTGCLLYGPPLVVGPQVRRHVYARKQ